MKVRKRDGRIVPFDQSKITNAVLKALLASGEGDGRRAQAVSDAVVSALPKRTLGVEEIQDAVEKALIRMDLEAAAKAYILYRQKKAEIRAAKGFLGVRDELKMSTNAINVLQKRYLLKDEAGVTKETPAQMFRRVARAIARMDAKHRKPADRKSVV
jgi:ribonucleoside-diphosphate reductase alpha chain